MIQAATRQVPLPDDLPGIDEFIWSEHAIQRMGERNISPFEAMACIVDAEITAASHERGATRYIRGDVSVIYNTSTNVVVTVSHRGEPTGTRTPLVPQAREPQMSRVTKMTGADVVAQAVKERKPGDTFTINELYRKYRENLEANYPGASEKRLKGLMAGTASYLKGRGDLIKTVDGYAIAKVADLAAPAEEEEVEPETDTPETRNAGPVFKVGVLARVEDAEAEGVLVDLPLPAVVAEPLTPREEVQVALSTFLAVVRKHCPDFTLMEQANSFEVSGRYALPPIVVEATQGDT